MKITILLFWALLSIALADVMRNRDVDCRAVSCLRPDCDDGEELFVPDGECCPQCRVDCSAVSCLRPDCDDGEVLFVPDGECCPQCRVDCSAVSCLRPVCNGYEQLFVPEGECCPRCGDDCTLVDCMDITCTVDTFIPEGKCCPVCPCDGVYCTLEVCGDHQIEVYLEGDCCKTCIDDCSTVRCSNPCGENETPVRREGGACCDYECVPDCENMVYCFLNPCEYEAECTSFPDATCVPNYCGGCFADFYIGDTKVENCDCGDVFCTLEICNPNEREIFEDGACCKSCEVCESICEIACVYGYDQLDVNCCPICNPEPDTYCKENEREVRREDGSIDCVGCECYADPCQVSECISFPDAECVSNLCSCTADFYIGENKIEKCDCSDTECPDFDESDPCVIKAEVEGECCPYYAIIDCAYPECAVEVQTREGECCPYCPCDLLKCYEPTDCEYGYENENTCCRHCREAPDVECPERDCLVDFEEREGQCPFCPCDAVRCGAPPECGEGVGFHHIEGEGCCSYECDDVCDRVRCKDVKCGRGYKKVIPEGECCPVCEVRNIRYVISMTVRCNPDLSIRELKELICSLEGIDCTQKIIKFLIHKHKENQKRTEDYISYDISLNTTDTEIIKILKTKQSTEALAQRGIEIVPDSINIATDNSQPFGLDEKTTSYFLLTAIGFSTIALSGVILGVFIKRAYFHSEKEIIPLDDFNGTKDQLRYFK